ncbi:hypothetical protein [Mycobacteroides chelonae]|nr:hypothetical protein [Mycobacteroides chelonae]
MTMVITKLLGVGIGVAAFIPGELDDQIIDGVAKRAAEILKRFGL